MRARYRITGCRGSALEFDRPSDLTSLPFIYIYYPYTAGDLSDYSAQALRRPQCDAQWMQRNKEQTRFGMGIKLVMACKDHLAGTPCYRTLRNCCMRTSTACLRVKRPMDMTSTRIVGSPMGVVASPGDEHRHSLRLALSSRMDLRWTRNVWNRNATITRTRNLL